MSQPSVQPDGRHRLTAIVTVLAVSLTAFVCSCSVKDNYKTLSFFFDGVPDPNIPPKNAGGGALIPDLRSSPNYSVHKPFQEERCDACHTNTYQLTAQDSGICLKCHQVKTSDRARMHGPVAAAACLWCHTGHESAEAYLFKAPARVVCTQCHEPGVLNAVRVPQHADPAKSCLECHFGHGGDAAYFLRPGVGGLPPRPSADGTPADPRATPPAAAEPGSPGAAPAGPTEKPAAEVTPR